METVSNLPLLFTAGIFLLAFLAFLLSGVNALLNAKIDPLKNNQIRLEENQTRLETSQARLEKNQAQLKEELQEIKSKLDQLLSKA